MVIFSLCPRMSQLQYGYGRQQPWRTSRYKELECKKTDILEQWMSYTALQPAHVNSTVQILRGILPARSRKKQEVISYHPLPHWRTSGQASNRYSIFMGSFSFSNPQHQSRKHLSPTTNYCKWSLKSFIRKLCCPQWRNPISSCWSQKAT